ncbi:MAG: 2-dehydropantoate 2-reductase [bacterium]
MKSFGQVIIYGAGAIGSYLGARLVTPTVLVARPDHVAAIRRDGLSISGAETDRVADATEIDRGAKATETDRVAIAAQTICPDLQPHSLILIAVKLSDLEAAADDLAPRLCDDTEVAVLSNGLDPEQRLAERFQRPVTRVIVQLGVTLDGPGAVTFWGGELMLGPGDREDRLTSLFEQSGFTVKRTRDLQRVVWQKFAVNCIANPLSALTGRRNCDLVTPELAGLRRLVLDEVRLLAASEGVTLADDLLERIDAMLAGSQNKTSMLQDVQRGRRTEIDYLNGLVARKAAAAGLEAPINSGLAALVELLTSYRDPTTS